ncbi:MAG: GntR family transcriptional regulator [Paenibacillus sp.]|nr:GntR family transcriptional regulator [Paenibacillus sp.]
MTSPQREKKSSKLNAMVQQLRNDILHNGKYAQGDFLPSELALVSQFGLSNKTVRKGLEHLIAEGLIEKVDRVGSKVIASARQPAATVIFGSMWSIERDMKISQLLERFRSSHPHIRVELVMIPTSDYTGTIESHLSAGLVDVIVVNDELFWQMTDRSEELPLQPLFRDERTYSYLNDSFTHRGMLYAQPLVFSPIVMAYNRDHFDEAGVPQPDGGWTWDDATRYAAKLSIPGQRYGLCFYPLSNNRWPVFLLQSGMDFTSVADGRVRLSNSKLIEHIKLYKNIIRNRDFFPDYLAESSRDFVHLFRRGQASMIISTYMSLYEFASDGPNYDLSPIPYRGEPNTLLTAIGIAINKHSRNKEAATTFVEFLKSPSSQRLIREQTLSIPAVREAAELAEAGGELRRPARFGMYRNIAPSFRRFADLGLSAAAFNKLRELLKLYGSDLIDEQTLCEQLEAAIRIDPFKRSH